mmetsp:Transcript_69465/g.165602  ORF Transcript_69465/g.165602 Transcript_69465/m.165602 type:complete len:275 (-) Transcript_69465:173-997(-)
MDDHDPCSQSLAQHRLDVCWRATSALPPSEVSWHRHLIWSATDLASPGLATEAAGPSMPPVPGHWAGTPLTHLCHGAADQPCPECPAPPTSDLWHAAGHVARAPSPSFFRTAPCKQPFQHIASPCPTLHSQGKRRLAPLRIQISQLGTYSRLSLLGLCGPVSGGWEPHSSRVVPDLSPQRTHDRSGPLLRIALLRKGTRPAPPEPAPHGEPNVDCLARFERPRAAAGSALRRAACFPLRVSAGLQPGARASPIRVRSARRLGLSLREGCSRTAV